MNLEKLLNTNYYDFKNKQKSIDNHVIMMAKRMARFFVYKNLPDTIPQNMIELYYLLNGTFCGAMVDGKPYIFKGDWGGEYGPYYLPTQYIVANPYLNISKTFNIGEDCVLFKNDSYYHGLRDLFEKYATLMAENELTIRNMIIQGRAMAIAIGTDDNAKRSLDTFFEHLEAGDIKAIGDDILHNVETQPFVDKLHQAITPTIELEQYLKASWFNEIGLSSNYNMKRESVNSAEANLGGDARYSLLDDMLKCRQEDWAKFNELFGFNVQVELADYIKDNIEKEIEENDEATEDKDIPKGAGEKEGGTPQDDDGNNESDDEPKDSQEDNKEESEDDKDKKEEE